jgi:hypothetical protein
MSGLRMFFTIIFNQSTTLSYITFCVPVVVYMSRKRRSQKRRMSYFCARSQRAARRQKESWRSMRERRSWSSPCQS